MRRVFTIICLTKPSALLSGVRRGLTTSALSECAESLPELVRPIAPLSGVRRGLTAPALSKCAESLPVLVRPIAPLGGASRGLAGPALSRRSQSLPQEGIKGALLKGVYIYLPVTKPHFGSFRYLCGE